jgi:hypothetical protein
MSWEEMGRNRRPCPCGKGEYEVVDFNDDWNQWREEVTMLCPSCLGKYRYVAVGHHKADIVEEWVSVERLQQAANENQERIRRVKSDCLSIWRAKLATCGTKKAVWELTTRTPDGYHLPAYGTFLRHNKGKTLDEIRRASEHVFESTFWHPVIYRVCGLPNPFLPAGYLVDHA